MPAARSISRFCAVLAAILMLFAIGTAASATGVVYSNDFSPAQNPDAPYARGFLGGPLTYRVIQTAPDGTTFLGFLNQMFTGPDKYEAALSLDGLDAHNTVTISFDLYALFYLDGDNSHGIGHNPSYFRLFYADTLHDLSYQPFQLMADTFSNGAPCGCGPGEPFQSYGGQGLSGVYPLGTGSLSHDKSGFGYCPVFDEPCGSGGEYTYHISYTIPDSSSSILFGFMGDVLSAQGDGGLPTEAFGIDNLVVTTAIAVPEPASWTLLIAGCGALFAYRRRSGRVARRA